MDGPSTPPVAATGVLRLKELLFQQEQNTLGELARRIEELDAKDRQIFRDLLERIEALSEAERQARNHLIERIDDLTTRAGDETRFRASVANVLDGALRDAEVARHDSLTDAMSPMVVRTVRTELRNSQDELVEALYPMTGRMVKAYIASAMKDLADSINQRLEKNTLVLRLRSLTSGRSMAELAMADTQWPRLEELYLIRRGTGELVGRWPELAQPGNQDLALGGILTAINEFALEAFRGEGANLRQIDVGSSCIYLRASPGYLLAAKLSGSAPTAVEDLIDRAYLSALEANPHVFGDADKDDDPQNRLELLTGLASRLDEDIATTQAAHELPPLGFKPLLIGLTLILLPLFGWLGWNLYGEHRTARVAHAARTAIAGIPELKGYDLRLDVSARGQDLSVTGLVPNADVAARAVERIAAVLPAINLREALTPIPANGIDPRPQIESVRRNVTETAAQLRQRLSTVETTAKETIAGVAETVQSDVRAVAGDVTGVRGEIRTVEATLKSQVASVRAALQRDAATRSLGRAVRRLEESQRELVQLRAATPSGTDRQVFTDATASLRSLAVALGGVRGDLLSAMPQDDQPVVRQLAGFRDAMEQQAARMATLLGRAAPQIAQVRGTTDLSLAEMADDLAASAEQLNVTVIGLVQAEAIRRGLPKPVVPQPTALETLREFVLTHAVFFTAATTLRDPTDAARTLDALARLLAQNDVTLRVVGYTDDTGGPDRNTSVSQERANAIVAELVQRGVRADRLISVGRTIGGEVSAQRGPDSPNRRVEFEIGFRGEVVR